MQSDQQDIVHFLQNKTFATLCHNVMHKAHNQVSPDSKVHLANMGPTWVLAAPGGHHVDHMNLAIREGMND